MFIYVWASTAALTLTWGTGARTRQPDLWHRVAFILQQRTKRIAIKAQFIYKKLKETLFDTVGISDTLHALVTMFKISILPSGSTILNLYTCKYVLYFENCSIFLKLQFLPFFCVYNKNVQVICKLEPTALWI